MKAFLIFGLVFSSISSFACESYSELTREDTTGNNVVMKRPISKVQFSDTETTVYFSNLTVQPSFNFY